MKTAMKKSLVAAALTAALGVASSSALAYPQFTVNESSVPGSSGAPLITADKIVGGYTEIITFASPTSFAASLIWDANNYFLTPNPTGLTGYLGNSFAAQYKMYGLYQAVGTVSTSGSTTTFTATPGLGSLNVYIDPASDTSAAAPANGASPWVTTDPSLDDYLIASGTPGAGGGTITCSTASLCGSFSTSATFNLTPAGMGYFTLPNPFYGLSFQAGQFNGFAVTPGATQTINGSLDVTFGNPTVPEPSSVALLGIGLLGMAAGVRRRRQA